MISSFLLIISSLPYFFSQQLVHVLVYHLILKRLGSWSLPFLWRNAAFIFLKTGQKYNFTFTVLRLETLLSSSEIWNKIIIKSHPFWHDNNGVFFLCLVLVSSCDLMKMWWSCFWVNYKMLSRHFFSRWSLQQRNCNIASSASLLTSSGLVATKTLAATAPAI